MPRAERTHQTGTATLGAMPLPDAGDAASKDDRGSVLVVGGTRETVGGVLLAGVAALRAGAGRIHLALPASAAAAVAVSVPEARVTALPEDEHGRIDPDRVIDALGDGCEVCDVALLGPGTVDPDATGDLIEELLAGELDGSVVVLDAAALGVLDASWHAERRMRGQRAMVLTPNVAEVARLMGVSTERVAEAPAALLREVIERFDVTAAIRGSTTWMSSVGRDVYVEADGPPALATAGSGDVLSGTLSGLLARGAEPLTAMIWAVAAHAHAGRELTARHGGLGLLASEIASEIPASLAALAAGDRSVGVQVGARDER